MTSLGKPSAQLGVLLKEKFNINYPQRCLFIGDALTEDVGFALACGFQTLYIMSRDNAREDLANLPAAAARPHYVADGLTDLLEFFQQL